MTELCRRCIVKDSQLDEAKNDTATWRKKYTDLLYRTLNVTPEEEPEDDRSHYPPSGYD